MTARQIPRSPPRLQAIRAGGRALINGSGENGRENEAENLPLIEGQRKRSGSARCGARGGGIGEGWVSRRRIPGGVLTTQETAGTSHGLRGRGRRLRAVTAPRCPAAAASSAPRPPEARGGRELPPPFFPPSFPRCLPPSLFSSLPLPGAGLRAVPPAPPLAIAQSGRGGEESERRGKEGGDRRLLFLLLLLSPERARVPF